MDIHESNKEFLEFLLKVPEFYCLEDYGNCTMIQALNNFNLSKKIGKPENYIALIFFFDNKEKQIFAEIKSLKKVFIFIKILNEGRDMNLLIKRKENYTGNEILSEINNNKYLKVPIKVKLDIFEFPIKNYSLYEKNKTKNDINIDKIYEIKCLNKTFVYINKYSKEKKTNVDKTKNFSKKENDNSINIVHNKNMFNNKINYNYLPNNDHFYNMNNSIQNNINYYNINNNIIELNNELSKVKEKNQFLENELDNEKNKNKKLEKIIYELKNKIKENQKHNNISIKEIEKESLYITILEKDKEISELKNKLSRFPFELNEGEQLMVINFKSVDQYLLNYSVVCKNTDIFNKIENKLYEDNPHYYRTENYFTVHGNKIHKNKSLEFNTIKNNDIIILNVLDI